MDREALVLENLTKSFEARKVLVKLSLAVRESESLVLLGPSGCGKTTLLRLIAGLDDADGGCIRIQGQIASNPGVLLSPNRRRVGMVFQDLALWPHMSAWQNVEFMLPKAMRGRKYRQAKACQILERVNLDGCHSQYPHQLSRGQQQRVALARALASEPAILLLDEPFASQDAELKAQMVDLIRELRRFREMTLLYVTHTTEEIPRLADRVAQITQGTISSVVKVAEFNRPSSPHENS